MAEELLDVLAVTDKNEDPVYGDCLLQVGEHVLQFKSGRAKISRDLAPLVARERNLTIPGYEPEEATAPELEGPQEPEAEEPEVDEEALSAAEEHLRAEGEEVPDRASKPALEPLTEDGNPRCQALKGDGSQCTNAATDGAACGLGAHRAQLS